MAKKEKLKEKKLQDDTEMIKRFQMLKEMELFLMIKDLNFLKKKSSKKKE